VIRNAKIPKKITREAPNLEVEVFRFILQRISITDWGIDTRTKSNRKGSVPHANTAARIKCALNGDPLPSGRRAFVPSITQKMLWEHQAGTKTLCFTGNGRSKAPETLFLIDVDCKCRPNYNEARRFLDDLKADTHVPAFASLFVEPSSSGGGAHGYGVLVKSPGLGDQSANSCLKKLQKYLRRRLAEGQKLGRYQGITDVEVKGTCPEIEWENNLVKEVRCGQLAKIPVTAIDRPKEFLGLARVPVDIMRRLHGMPIEFPKEPQKLTTKSTNDSLKRRGSTRRHPISRAIIERIGSVYLRVAQQYIPEPLRTTDRHVATAQDVAI
jgi:hypothetical protein